MWMKQLCGMALCGLALSLAACESEPVECDLAPGTGDPGAFLSVTGFTIQHSLSKKAAEASGQALDLSNLVVDLIDPGLEGDDGPLTLASAPFDTSGSQGPFPWSFSGIDVPTTVSALMASIRDGRTSDPLWVTTWAFQATNASLTQLRETSGALGDVHTFALTYDTLYYVIGPLVGLSGDELLARGMVLGVVSDQASSCGEAAPAVSGRVVTSSQSDLTIYYPNSTVSDLSDETANQGIFFAIPNAPGGIVQASFSVTSDADDSLQWEVDAPAWISPDVVTIQVFTAK